MPVTHLSDRAILAIEAPNQNAAVDFLQPLVTQNVEKLAIGELQYALHLTPQGRLVADMFLFWHPEREHVLCLDVHRDMLMPLAKRLHGYILGQSIELHDLSAEIQVTASWEDVSEGWADPRLPDLGQRCYKAPNGQTATATLEDYHVHRLTLGVLDVYYDCPPEKALPAQCNMQHLHAIDFNKGCYVGQEVTARLHFKAKKPTKILYQATSDHGDLMPLMHPQSGAEVGWLGQSFGGQALAVMQARLTPELFTNLHLTLPAYLPSDMVIKNQK